MAYRLEIALKLLPALLLALLPFVANPLRATEIVPADCVDFINEAPPRVTCGFFTLPLNHDKPDAGTIRLPILIAHSTRSMLSRSSRAILIPGAGGPGASMGFGYRYRRGEFLEPYEGLLEAGNDLIILDQRGAGLSSPRLTCFESIKVFSDLISSRRNTALEIQKYQQSATECRTRLQDTGLAHFDTIQSARDFITVIEQLPYEWWGTIATSYATVIAQTMLTLKPDVFDSVVLDSPVPLDYQQPLTSESSFQAVMKSIQRCSQTVDCQSRYPNLEESFELLIAGASSQPFDLTIKALNHSGRVDNVRLVVDEHLLLSIFATAIYHNDGIVALPSVINQMSNGNLNALQLFAQDFWYQSTDDTYADGLSLTVHCKERQSLEQRYIENHPDYLSSLSEYSRQLLSAQTDLCKAWGVQAEAYPSNHDKIKVPSLLISGSLDPVISEADIANTLDDFLQIKSDTVHGAGHAVWFQSACVRQAITDFFESGTADHLSKCELEIPEFR